MSGKKLIGVSLATAAALAFASAPITSAFAAGSSDKVQCFGVNSCKGKSACKTAKNSCKGENACKGQGFMMKTAKKCKKAGGTTEQPADAAAQPADAAEQPAS